MFELSGGAMEPDAMNMVRELGAPALAGAAQQLSQAISLKRIADALADPHRVGGYIEEIAFNAGRAFEHGRRQ